MATTTIGLILGWLIFCLISFCQATMGSSILNEKDRQAGFFWLFAFFGSLALIWSLVPEFFFSLVVLLRSL